MMQTDIPEGKGRGTWQLVLNDEFGAPYWSAVIWCPECGVPLPLQRGHRIAEDGQVTPSVGHDPKWPPCGWHTYPKLLGWRERVVPDGKPLPVPPVPAEQVCERCGAKTRALGGWGTWSEGRGLICPACIQARSEPLRGQEGT